MLLFLLICYHVQREHNLFNYSFTCPPYLSWEENDVLCTMGGNLSPFPQGLLRACIVLFTSHAFNSSLHYIALSFFSHAPRESAYDGEQMESVLSILATSHICLLADFHKEIKRVEEGNKNRIKDWPQFKQSNCCTCFFERKMDVIVFLLLMWSISAIVPADVCRVALRFSQLSRS